MINASVGGTEMTVTTSQCLLSERHVCCSIVAFEITLNTFSLPFYVLEFEKNG